jgi:hypothetical protein
VQYCTYRIQAQRRHETGNVLVHSWHRDHPNSTVLPPIPIEMNEHWPMRTLPAKLLLLGGTPEARSQQAVNDDEGKRPTLS